MSGVWLDARPGSAPGGSLSWGSTPGPPGPRNTVEYDDSYAILPAYHDWDRKGYLQRHGGRPCPEGFRYSSETNSRWLSVEELQEMIEACLPQTQGASGR